MKKYVDSCRTLEILKQDSGLLPKPTEAWNTFEPQIGDLAYVSETNSEYEFNGVDWIKKEGSSLKRFQRVPEVRKENFRLEQSDAYLKEQTKDTIEE
jgi:hypothetical protein